jgi:hypothetical protein
MGQPTSCFEWQEGSLKLTVGVLVPEGLCLLTQLRHFNCFARLRSQLESNNDLFGSSVERQKRGRNSAANPWGLLHESLLEYLGQDTQLHSTFQAARLDSFQNLYPEQ